MLSLICWIGMKNNMAGHMNTKGCMAAEVLSLKALKTNDAQNQFIK